MIEGCLQNPFVFWNDPLFFKQNRNEKVCFSIIAFFIVRLS